MIILWFVLVGLVLLVGHMTCAVLRSGHGKRADELADAAYRRRAEARLRGLAAASRGEVAVYRRAAVKMRTRAEREADAVVEAAGF